MVFTPKSGEPVAAPIKDGKYSAEGVPTGEVLVSLDLSSLDAYANAFAPKTGAAGMGAMFGKGDASQKGFKASMNPSAPNLPPAAKKQMEEQARAAAEAKKMAKLAIPLLKAIPDKYRKPDTSGLTLDVSSGSNTFDIKLP